MAIAKTSKINIIANIKYQEKFIETIQDSGLMQIEEHIDNDLPKTDIGNLLNEIEYKLAGAKFGLSFLAEYDTGKKSLAEKINPKIELSEKELENKVNSFNFKIFKEIQEVQRKINEAHNIIEKSKEEISQLAAWKNLNLYTFQRQSSK
jgi:vacuolar-type H+-ATPase subunit I/STV1